MACSERRHRLSWDHGNFQAGRCGEAKLLTSTSVDWMLFDRASYDSMKADQGGRERGRMRRNGWVVRGGRRAKTPPSAPSGGIVSWL
ncbi:hypothetical protein E2C01_086934 [Portunus trituberculatus]|uniref:Uncharacterized protein n=1 Tax=Portunus trituberculatus TaxID=210409 RepID=A0A5B7JBY6_PORTR|nr:hypothetical protein [Portunus trituberculatus]